VPSADDVITIKTHAWDGIEQRKSESESMGQGTRPKEWVYVLRQDVDGVTYSKIGITRVSVGRRANAYSNREWIPYAKVEVLGGAARAIEHAAHRELRERRRAVHAGSREIFEVDPEEALRVIQSLCETHCPVVRYKDFVPTKLHNQREAAFRRRVSKLVILGALAIAALTLAFILVK
jgi:T5orf172 domain